MARLAIVTGLTLFALACGTDPALLITEDGIRYDVEVLSADSMEGRAPGTAGEGRAVAHISQRFEDAGLQPAGDNFALPFDLIGMSKNEGRSRLTIRGHHGLLPFTDNVTFTWWSASEREVVDIDDVPVLFVGYGVEAPEHDWDDFAGEDVSGKVLLFLNNDPPVEEDGVALFGGPARTYYGRWTYKFEQAMKHGAAGAIVIHTTQSASYPFSVIGNTGGRENWARDYKVDLLGWIDSTSSERIAESMGTTLTGLFDMAAQREFKPRDTGFRISAHIETDIRRVATYNIAGVLPGSDPDLRDQYIVFTAHYDHLGINPTADGGDTIYNGAWDNASGTATIINMAEAFVASSPRRSIMFVAVGAEEGGLLGSGAFVANPPVPLNQIVANINIDMLQIFGETHDVAAIGLVMNTMGAVLREVAESHGLRAVGDPDPNAGSFYRSDQVSFAKAGVPALSLQRGQDFIEPLGFDPVDYHSTHYHQVSDIVSDEWNFAGTVRDARIVFETVMRIANADDVPRWMPGNEFEEEWKELYERSEN